MERRTLRVLVLVIGLTVCGGIVGESVASGPEIKILFAGDPDGSGGPYWLPPFESSTYGLADDGYYTDRSQQEEDWIQIKAEVTDQQKVVSVELYWRIAVIPDQTVMTYGPYDFERDSGQNRWVIDTSELTSFPQPQEGLYYSFDITATDLISEESTVGWFKTGPDSTTVRRWVQLDYDHESIDYTPYYLGNGSFTMDLNGERYAKDRFNHDTGANEGDWDVGALLAEAPSTIEQRKCSQFVAYWFDTSVCDTSVTVSDIYYHIWTSSRSENWARHLGWGRTREDLLVGYDDIIDWHEMPTQTRSTYTYYDGEGDTEDDYGLYTGLMDDLDTSEIFTDNSIYEMFLRINHPMSYPAAISSRATPSFVIFNLPPPWQLFISDSDGDGLSDDRELFGTLTGNPTYTSPFLADTDDDGYDDDEEVVAGTDPNDPDDTPTGREALDDLTMTQRLQLRMENPLLAGSAIAFSLPVAGEVELSIFDVEGRQVRSLANGTFEAGDHAVTWDGSDSKGRSVSAGLYFCTLKAAGQKETSKFILTR